MQETDAGKEVYLDNTAYAALLKKKIGNDNYVAHDTQTIDSLMTLRKTKEVQTQIVARTSVALQTNQYDLWCSRMSIRCESSSSPSVMANPTGITSNATDIAYKV